MEDLKKIVDQWGKPNQRLITHLRHRNLIFIFLAGAIAVLVAFLVIFNSTDLIAKPIKSLASTSGVGDWAMFGHDPEHSGAVNAESKPPQGNVTALLDAGDEIHSAPVVAQGIIYIGSRDYNLYAIDGVTGAVRWKFKAGSYIDNAPVVADNVVYFGSNDGKLYALNATAESELWEFKTQYAVRSSVAVANGKVYFGADDYKVHALDAATGKEIWSFATDNQIESSPVVANGIVYIGSADEYLYALDANTGRLRLQFPAGGVGGFSPVAVDKTIYIASSGGILSAIDGNARNWFGENQLRPTWETLHIYGVLPKAPTLSGYLWTLKLNGTVTSSPSIAGNSLFIGMANKLVAVDLQTHTKLWEFPAGSRFSATPAVSGNLVLAPCENGHLYILDATTGAKIQDITVGGKLTSSAAVVGSTTYLSSQEGKVYSIK